MSSLVAQNVRTIGGRTSIRLEPELWKAMDDICRKRHWSRSQLVVAAETAYQNRPRTSAVRTYLFTYFRSRVTEIA